jgi:hypothetical protein
LDWKWGLGGWFVGFGQDRQEKNGKKCAKIRKNLQK